MGQVTRERVGSIGLIDLADLCEIQGREGLPYPFFSRAQLGSLNQRGGREVVRARVDGGDLHAFGQWAEAYLSADIWVEGRVHYLSPETPDLRVLAYRADRSGFIACQRPDEDVVDVDRLSPHELGSAVAEAVRLGSPGSRPSITIPAYAGTFTKTVSKAVDEVDEFDDDYVVSVRDTSRRAPAGPVVPEVSDAEVVALAVVQSRCDPSRSWGLNWDRNAVVWTQIADDGDYVYAPDFSRATPVTAQVLSERIDQLIAADVTVLRQRRGLT